MASIFLSYSREDSVRAGRIAQALELAGHDVWWDRRIGAGSRFSKEIDAALKKADLVVVLWSKVSVESAWVQDEAADGRDSERLVPVLIDKVSPPLGFRQYQSIDLSRGWRGSRPAAPLLDAVAARIGKAHAEPGPKGALAGPWQPVSAWKSAALVALAVAILMAAYFVLGRQGGGHTIAIAPEGGDEQRSQEFARTLALGLSQYRSGPLGRLTILREGQKGSANADYLVGVGISDSNLKMFVDLSLSDSSDSEKLWATVVEGEPLRLADMRQQAMAALGQVLTCLGEVKEQRATISRESLGIYLDGCGKVSDINLSVPDEQAMSLFKKLTEREPQFAPGWARLSLLQTQSLPGTPVPDQHKKVLSARANVKKAKALEPTLDIVYLAEANLPENFFDPAKALAIVEEGLRRHPDSAMLREQRSYFLSTVGRISESMSEAVAATELGPLSPAFRDTYISALAYAGKTEHAFNELRRAESIWPGSTVLRQARYRLDLRYGDPANALRLLGEDTRADASARPDTAWRSFLEARMDPSPAKIEAALDEFRARNRNSCCDWGYLQALGTFNRVDEAFRAMESDEAIDAYGGSVGTFFRVHMRPIYSDPRFIRVAQRLGLLDYWRKSGRWPDFCREPKLPYDCQEVASKLASPRAA
jgi:hypothetical protein